MDEPQELDEKDRKLFQDDFQEVPLDETTDKASKKVEKTVKTQPASLDVLDGLVKQAKMEEIRPPDEKSQHPSKADESNPDDAKSDPDTSNATATMDPDSSNAVNTEASPSLSESLQTPAESSGPSTDSATILAADQLLNAPPTAEEPHDADEDLDEDGDPLETEGIAKTKTKPEYPENAHMEAAAQVSLEPVRVLEAALFLANKPMSHKQLQDLLSVPRDRLDYLLADLARVVPKESSYELSVNEHGAALQLKPHYLHRVARLSKEVELSKKAMRILALVAKKKELMQSDLKHFFKGEIYAYVTELKMAGYLESKKHGNTRKLKPTSKFYESFQVKE